MGWIRLRARRGRLHVHGGAGERPLVELPSYLWRVHGLSTRHGVVVVHVKLQLQLYAGHTVVVYTGIDV